jgi:hypothetical protein
VKALAAHAHLVRATLAIHRFLTIYDPCATPYSCDVARKSALSALLEKVAEPDVDPLPSDLAEDTSDNLESLGMCSECRELATMHLRDAASAFWDELPSIFGLPPWKELRAMKRAAMEENEDEEI